MSNYRAGLATAIHLGEAGLQAPRDPAWWAGYQPFVIERYDTPAVEKWRAQHHKLPACLSVTGERVFHWHGGDLGLAKEDQIAAQIDHIIDGAGPGSGHPALSWTGLPPRERRRRLGLHFSSYGGDYWLAGVWSNPAFWQGLHDAGTRGQLVLEVGCEVSETFLGYPYDFHEAAWPAWFLLLADLNASGIELTRIYPPTAPLEAARAQDQEDVSDQHFYRAFKGRMLQHARESPLREPSRVPHSTNPWQI